MTAKRFYMTKDGDLYNNDNLLMLDFGYSYDGVNCKRLIDLLNELYEEKEDWKHNCLITVSENSILWNEISILREQGAEPSDAFKNYLNNLKNKNKKLQGDGE